MKNASYVIFSVCRDAKNAEHEKQRAENRRDYGKIHPSSGQKTASIYPNFYDHFTKFLINITLREMHYSM